MLGRGKTVWGLAAASVALSGCLGGRDDDRAARGEPVTVSSGGVLGFGGDDVPFGLGVNAFLWRASLDTLNFLPIAQADPYGGLILTDWYVNPEIAGERFKAQVYILDTRLRADALSVAVFKQVRDGQGGWLDTAVDPDTPISIENAILTRARQLRIATLDD
ncbi:MAG: DUF3576 domain-containing protein [Maricaulaceae bacterium]